MRNYKKNLAKNFHFLEASDVHPANTYFHFSFANYYDPERMNFGVLRVLNDDRVRAKGGFGTHPHQDMEIFSYVVSGKLTHRDSFGNHEILDRGSVQAISAGIGLTHSEINEQDEECRFLQIWILPESQNLPVKYEPKKIDFESRNNKLLHLVTNSKNLDSDLLKLNQDVNIYVSEMTDKNVKLGFKIEEGRQAYIFCFEGSIGTGEDVFLDKSDSLEIKGSADLEFSLSSEMAHFIIIEMEKSDD